MCHTLPRIGYKMPYNSNINKGFQMTVTELNPPKNESLEEFIKRDQIKQQLRENVKVWTEQYCDAITQNYKEYHVRSLNSNVERYKDGRPELSDYAKQQLAELEDGTANLMKFRIQEGRKYYKVIQQNYDTFQDRNYYRDGSVHSFVDKNTGEVYMAASWSSPAKHVRFDMRVIRDRTLMHTPSFVNWTSGYLYLR